MSEIKNKKKGSRPVWLKVLNVFVYVLLILNLSLAIYLKHGWEFQALNLFWFGLCDFFHYGYRKIIKGYQELVDMQFELVEQMHGTIHEGMKEENEIIKKMFQMKKENENLRNQIKSLQKIQSVQDKKHNEKIKEIEQIATRSIQIILKSFEHIPGAVIKEADGSLRPNIDFTFAYKITKNKNKEPVSKKKAVK